jgi:uncharacterized protein YndB with AHSA1/START domain
MSYPTLTISNSIHAGLDRVWACYTEPEHITQWNFASADWHCPSARNDLQKGGSYSARMEAKDGSFGFDFEAIYDEVVAGEKLAYTMADGRKVTVRFEPRGGQTELSIDFEAERENPLELQRDGWQAILNNFKQYVEGS